MFCFHDETHTFTIRECECVNADELDDKGNLSWMMVDSVLKKEMMLSVSLLAPEDEGKQVWQENDVFLDVRMKTDTVKTTTTRENQQADGCVLLLADVTFPSDAVSLVALVGCWE